jgi:hypothetical protein
MALPQTRDGLERIGYKYLGDGVCRACGVPVQWFETTRRNPTTGHLGKLCFHIEAGHDELPHLILIPHFASCPNAKDFRKNKPKRKK